MDSVADDEIVPISIFSSLEEIVYYVLKHLPMKELHRVAGVNSIWNKVVKQIKRNRKQLSWCLYSDTEVGGLDEQIGQILENMSSEPSFALVFCSSSLHESTVSIPSKSAKASSRLPRAAKQEKIQFTDFLKRILPPLCHLTGICTDGVVGSDFHSNRVLEMESSSSASCLLLPKIDGVDLYNFVLGNNLDSFDHESTGMAMDSDDSLLEPEDLPDQERNYFPAESSVGQANSMTSHAPGDVSNGSTSEMQGKSPAKNDFVDMVTGIPEGKDPKLVLLFLTDPYYAYDKELGHKLLERYPDVVIAGGYTDNLILDATLSKTLDYDDEPSGLGVAFCGKDIRVASVLLQPTINEEKKIEAELARLKSSHIPERRSVGFMFACIGRGQNFYNGRENVESKAFRKFFPNTPLLGFFGNGEIGFNHIPDFSKPVASKRSSAEDGARMSQTIYHSYTTIFVMVSFP